MWQLLHSVHDVRNNHKEFLPYDNAEYVKNLSNHQKEREWILRLKDQFGEMVVLRVKRNFKTPYGRECFCLTGTTTYENARFRVEAYVFPHRPERNIVKLQKTIDLAL